jgi:DNA-binding CsgD family transcriptional regulator
MSPKNDKENSMAPRRKEPFCEIIFGQLRIPVWDQEKGKRVIEGIFMIGESGKGKAKARGRRKQGRRAKRRARGRRGDKTRRIKKIARLKEKGLKASQIAKKIGVSPMTVARDLKGMKKEE